MTLIIACGVQIGWTIPARDSLALASAAVLTGCTVAFVRWKSDARKAVE